MSKKHKTAVDILWNSLIPFFREELAQLNYLREKVKIIEKEQIINDYNKGREDRFQPYVNAEKHYKETYE